MRSQEENESQIVVMADEIPVVLLPDDVDIEEDLIDDVVDELDDPDLVDERLVEELEQELSLEESGFPTDLSMPRLYHVMGWLVLVGLSIFFIIGWTYYQLPVARRPFHYFHEALRASGTLGLPLGIAGTLLMAASFLYLVRKEFVSWTWMGSIRSWMAFHIFAGLVGPALILFHANFIPYSPLGMLAFVSMVIVVLSGILGRYVYAFFPRTLEGRELEMEDLIRRLVVYRRKLVELGINPALLDVGAPSEDRSSWLLGAFSRVVYGDRDSREEFERIRTAVHAKAGLGVQRERILILMRRLFRERQWLVRYRELRNLIGAWRFFHRWLAIVMLAAIFFHIVIAVDFGDLWIFGGRG